MLAVSQLSLPHNQNKKITKNGKPLSRLSPVQYSPRRQSRWVLADYGGNNLWKRWVLSLEWNSERVMGESGEQVGGEFVSVISSAGCFVQLLAEWDRKLIPQMRWCIAKWAIGDSYRRRCMWSRKVTTDEERVARCGWTEIRLCR